MKRKYKLLTFGDREKIAEMCTAGNTLSDISEAVGVSLQTVYRELKRGFAGEIGGCKIYDPNLAETVVREKIKKRGRVNLRAGLQSKENVAVVKVDPETGEIKVAFSAPVSLTPGERARIVAESLANRMDGE
jgi:IS30 family transposase